MTAIRNVWFGCCCAAWAALTGCSEPTYGAAVGSEGGVIDSQDAAINAATGADGRSTESSVRADAGRDDRRAPPVTPGDAEVGATAIDAGGAAELTGTERGRDASAQSTAEQPPADSGVSEPVMAGPGAALPAWTTMLPGRYALKAVAFTEDQRVMIRWNELAFVDIQRTGDHYEAMVTPCSDIAETASGLSGGGRGVVTLATRRHKVDITASDFSLVPIEVASGYDDLSPAACEGQTGKSVPKRPQQTWIRGDTCRCTEDALPAVDDCRVIDSESDNRPGITLTSQGLTGSTTLWGVFADRSSYVNGKVGNAGAHTALYQSNQQGAQYGCEGALCGVPSNPTYCSIEYNRAQFARLDGLETPPGGWGCAAVVERLTSLFPTTAPAFPAHCKP